MNFFKRSVAAMVMLCTGLSAMADSIAPTTFSATLAVGQSTTLRKVVTVDQQVNSAVVDVMFVLDNTGSMSTPLNSLRTNLQSAMTDTATLGDVRWGVAKFEDVPTSPWGSATDTPWTLLLQPTSDQAAVETAATFPLRDGSDWPEANLIALRNAAQETSWRPGAARYIVYLTDAHGHDPDTTSGYPGPTLQQAIDALKAANIKVLAYVSNNATTIAQAQQIVTATNGWLDSLDLLTWGQRIKAGVDTLANNYTTVSLGLNNPPGVDVSFTPVNHPAGPYNRNVTRTFEFDVTFTGVTPGTHNFTIDGLVDGGTVATETDTIVVPATPGGGTTGGPRPVPADAPLALVLAALGLGLLSRRKLRTA